MSSFPALPRFSHFWRQFLVSFSCCCFSFGLFFRSAGFSVALCSSSVFSVHATAAAKPKQLVFIASWLQFTHQILYITLNSFNAAIK
jgi:hypothetical protein